MCLKDCNLGDIYKITNIKTNKIYIGQASHWIKKKDKMIEHGYKKRFKEHIRKSSDLSLPKLYEAIEKFGKDNFTCELLETCKKEDLDSREEHYISFFNSINNGYNISKGGNTKNRNVDFEKLSSSIKELWKDNSYRLNQQISHTQNWHNEDYYQTIANRNRELPHNIYAYYKKDILTGYEVTIKRKNKRFRKLFVSGESNEYKLKKALLWRDEILKNLSNNL